LHCRRGNEKAIGVGEQTNGGESNTRILWGWSKRKVITYQISSSDNITTLGEAIAMGAKTNV
jgi:hypothetical protein